MEPKPSQNWGNLAVSVAAIIIGVIGVNSTKFEWLLYICAPVLGVAVFLMIWQTRFGKYISRLYESRRDQRHLAKQLSMYRKLVIEAKIAEKLFKAVSDLNWKQNRPSIYRHPEGYINQLLSISKGFGNGGATEFLYLNDSLNRHLEYIDSYLSQTDHLVVNRDVEFQYESEKTRLHKVIREYEEFINRHSRFCGAINSKLSSCRVQEFYGSDLCYSPKEMKPEEA